MIGAGVAGLVAADELELLGHRVEVLEASTRLGGRVYTHRFGSDETAPFVELGAMRIPMSHTRTLQLIAKVGLLRELREFRTLFSDGNNLVSVGDGHYLPVRDAIGELVKDLAQELGTDRYRPDTVLFGAWLKACLTAIAPREFEGRPAVTPKLLDLVEEIELAPYLRGDGTRIDLYTAFGDHPHLRSAVAADQPRVLEDVLQETSSAIFRLRCGMDKLVNGLAMRLRAPVRLEHEVVGLSVHDEGVVVSVRHKGVTTRHFSRYILCTAPFTVMRQWRLEGFDEAKLDTIRTMQYWPGTKVALLCRENFWAAEGIAGGASFTGGATGQTYYPAQQDDEGAAVLLASYTIGPDADALDRLDAQARHRVVADEVGRMHPNLRRPGMILESITQSWGESPWSRGAAVIRWHQDSATMEKERWAAARPQGRLFFAGEHCSSMPAWIEGAVESGMQAARSISAQAVAKGEVPPLGVRRTG